MVLVCTMAEKGHLKFSDFHFLCGQNFRLSSFSAKKISLSFFSRQNFRLPSIFRQHFRLSFIFLQNFRLSFFRDYISDYHFFFRCFFFARLHNIAVILLHLFSKFISWCWNRRSISYHLSDDNSHFYSGKEENPVSIHTQLENKETL